MIHYKFHYDTNIDLMYTYMAYCYTAATGVPYHCILYSATAISDLYAVHYSNIYI